MAALLIPGLVFFGALVLVALAQTANVHTKATTEAQQSTWAALLDQLTGRTYVKAITKATRSAVSRWALAQLKPVTAWFVSLNALLLDVFRVQTQTAETTASAVERIVGRTTPKALSRASAPALKQAKTATAKAQTAGTKASSTSAALATFKVAQRARNAHYSTAIDVAIPGQLGRIRTRTDTLERGQAGLRERTKALEDGAVDTWRWIRSHPFAGTTGVFAGAVAIALSRLGFGFLRCRSWQRVGRSLTCSQADNLGALLGLAGTAALVSEFRELVKLAQTVEHATAEGIKDLAGL